MSKGVWSPAGQGVEWRLDNDARGKYSNVIARLLLPLDVQSKRDLVVKISQKRLLVQFNISKVTGPETAVDGELARMVLAEESTWTIEEEGRERYLVLHLAKKTDGENWPALFQTDLAAVEERIAEKPDNKKIEQDEKLMKARAASDAIVLRGLMEKLQPESRVELEGLLARGASASDVIKVIQAQRQGKMIKRV
jgi:hypothetical protein